LLPHILRPLSAHPSMRRPRNGGHPFQPTAKRFQRTAPGRVSPFPDAALHQTAALCGQGARLLYPFITFFNMVLSYIACVRLSRVFLFFHALSLLTCEMGA